MNHQLSVTWPHLGVCTRGQAAEEVPISTKVWTSVVTEQVATKWECPPLLHNDTNSERSQSEDSYVPLAAAICHTRCSYMPHSLQPYVTLAAAICHTRCSHMSHSLRPCVTLAAAICHTRCSYMSLSLLPYATRCSYMSHSLPYVTLAAATLQ